MEEANITQQLKDQLVRTMILLFRLDPNAALVIQQSFHQASEICCSVKRLPDDDEDAEDEESELDARPYLKQ